MPDKDEENQHQSASPLLMPPTVFMDESNSTGENLLDSNQPIFALAGLHLADREASEIVNRVRAALPTGHGEAKYAALANTHYGREALLQAFEAIPHHAASAYVVHKPLMVVTKMVDLLVEERFHSLGYEMHLDGSAHALAQLIYFVGPVLGDPSAYHGMLRTFVDAVRYRSKASVADLFASIENYRKTCDSQWQETVELLELCRDEADELVARVSTGDMRDCLDPAIPTLVPLCHEFGSRVGVFRLVHDRSNVIARQKEKLLALDLLPDPMRPGKNLPLLPVSALDFSDSTSSPQLQIVDWIAGATRQWSTRLISDQEDVFASRLEPHVQSWLLGGIWPDPGRIAGPSQ